MNRATLLYAARRATQTLTAALVAFGIMTFFGLPQTTWALISALFVVQPNIGSTLSTVLDRIYCAILGTAVGLSLLYLLGHGGWHTALGLAISAAILEMVATYRPGLRFAHVLAAILIVAPGGDNVMVTALERALAIGIGAAVAALAALLVFPQSAHGHAVIELASASRCAGELLRAVMANLMGKASHDLDPIHVALRKHLETAATRSSQSLRSRFHRRRGPTYGQLLYHLQRLWHSLIILSRLAAEPLPDGLKRALGTTLVELAEEGKAHLFDVARALEGMKAMPEAEGLVGRLTELHERVLARCAPPQAPALPAGHLEPVYALAFSLQELARNLEELHALFEEA
jgi:uncharacterized membrane protein YccC